MKRLCLAVAFCLLVLTADASARPLGIRAARLNARAARLNARAARDAALAAKARARAFQRQQIIVKPAARFVGFDAFGNAIFVK